MNKMSINQVSFDTVSQVFENSVFVIPTFKRWPHLVWEWIVETKVSPTEMIAIY